MGRFLNADADIAPRAGPTRRQGVAQEFERRARDFLECGRERVRGFKMQPDDITAHICRVCVFVMCAAHETP